MRGCAIQKWIPTLFFAKPVESERTCMQGGLPMWGQDFILPPAFSRRSRSVAKRRAEARRQDEILTPLLCREPAMRRVAAAAPTPGVPVCAGAGIHAARDAGGHPDHGDRGGFAAGEHLSVVAQRRASDRLRPRRAAGPAEDGPTASRPEFARMTPIEGQFDPEVTGASRRAGAPRSRPSRRRPRPGRAPPFWSASSSRSGGSGSRRHTLALEGFRQSRLAHDRSRTRAVGSRAGVTLIELLVAISLLSLLSVGMLMALRVGLSALDKATRS